MTHDYFDYISTSVEEMISMGFSIKTIAKRYNLDEKKLKLFLENKKAIRDHHEEISKKRCYDEQHKTRKNK